MSNSSGSSGTVATAYVAIMPSAEGIKKNLESAILPATEAVGETAGQKLSEKLTGAGSALTKAGDKLEKTGKKLSANVTAPVIALGTVAVNAATDFDYAMAQVLTIADTSGTEGSKSIEALRAEILQLSSDVGVSASEIAGATYSAISAGQSTADSVNFVAAAAKLAQAGFTDMSTATDTLTTALNAYGLEAGEVTSISDKLITTQNLGKTTVAELGTSLGRVIPTAAAFGVNFDQLSAAFVTTTKNGIATAESATYINGMLNELGKSGTTAAELLKEKTGQSFSALMAEGNSLTDVLSILQAAADESNKSIMDMFGSQEAGKAAAALIQHTDDFAEAVIAMGESAGTAEVAFATMQDTAAVSFEKLKTEGTNALIALGDVLLPILFPALEKLTQTISEVSAWWNSLDDSAQKNILTFAGVAAAIGPVLVLGGKLTSLGGKLVTGAGKLTGWLSNLHTAASSGSTALSGLGGAASSAAAPVQSAGSSVGALSKNALGLVAAGAGILLASAGLYVLSQAAIQIAEAGPGAAVAMAGLVGAIALMAAGAAALAPALTAGAVGLVAFGAAVTLVGVGALAAAYGMSLLAPHLPTIADYGAQAAAAILELGVGLTAFTLGATLAGGGAVTLTVALTAFSPFALGAFAALTALAGGLTLAAGGMALLATSTALVKTNVNGIAASAANSASALSEMVASVDIVQSGLDALESAVDMAGDALKNVFRTAGDSLADSAGRIGGAFSGIKSQITSSMNAAVSEVRSGVNEINTAARSVSIDLYQHIAVPHFSLSGSFDASTRSVPSIGVTWYAKGGILTDPTIFGMSGGNFLGGGEAGPEAVLPLSTLKDYIDHAVNDDGVSAEQLAQLRALSAQVADLREDIKNMRIYIDGRVIAGYVDTALAQKSAAAGRGVLYA